MATDDDAADDDDDDDDDDDAVAGVCSSTTTFSQGIWLSPQLAGCWKACNSWCSDTASTSWYFRSGTSVTGTTGTAWGVVCCSFSRYFLFSYFVRVIVEWLGHRCHSSRELWNSAVGPACTGSPVCVVQ